MRECPRVDDTGVVASSAGTAAVRLAPRDRESDKLSLDIGIHCENAEIGRSGRAAARHGQARAPGPSMSIKPVVLLRSGRAELSVIVPVTEKLIVLFPAVLSAWVMT